jgi:hypothetical protein
MNTFITQITLDIGNEAINQGLFGAENAQTADGGFGLWLGNLMKVVMVLGAVACLALIIWGAIAWITAGGDKNKVEEARNRITTAIIGLIVLGASVALFNLLASFLGITTINFV